MSPMARRIAISAAFAAICALVVAPLLYVFLFAILLSVGSSSALIEWVGVVVMLTVMLLGVSDHGALVPVVVFWSLAVFASAFLYAFFCRKLTLQRTAQ